MVNELKQRRRCAVPLSAVGAALLTLPSCVETERQVDEIRVTGVASLDADGVPTGCDDEASPGVFANIGVVLRTDGTPVLDRTQDSVFAFLCVRNEGTSDVRLYEYDVGAGTSRALPEVVLVPGGRAAVEIEVLSAEAVSAEKMEQDVATEIVAGVAIYGRTALGTEVETPEFFMPVRLYRLDELCVCDGDPALGEVACPGDDAGCL